MGQFCDNQKSWAAPLFCFKKFSENRMDTGLKCCHFYGTDKGLHFRYKVKRKLLLRRIYHGEISVLDQEMYS